jgi:aspartate aminotransferase-like enzyme
MENRHILQKGMKKFGFKEFLDDSHEGYIITSFHFPKHPNFDFMDFYKRLSDKGQVIYPGKVSKADCFRIGNIGYLFPKDMEYLNECIGEVLKDMNIPTPLEG